MFMEFYSYFTTMTFFTRPRQQQQFSDSHTEDLQPVWLTYLQGQCA